MSEEKDIDQTPKSSGTPEDVNEIALHEQAIEQPKTQSENMEVHHHPDLHRKPKKWKEYLLEGFMIFIAVTLGFFAESLREGILNNEKEHHYIESLVQDLKKDTAEMNVAFAFQKVLIKKMDSALRIPVEKLTDISIQDTFYHHFTFFYSFVFLFYQNDNTITQLKNAGGFSVIRKKEVVDSIGQLQLYYDQYVKLNRDYYNDFWKKVADISPKLIKCPEPSASIDTLFNDIPVHGEVFTRYERPLLEELYSWIRNEKGTLLFYMNVEAHYRDMTINAIDFITREYDLKNE
jgi:hypothetical protein